MSDNEILREVRKYISNPIIIVDKTSSDTKEIIISIAREEILECNTLSDLCKNIVNKLDNKFSKQWHCSASYDNVSDSFHNYNSETFISLSFGKLKIVIFKRLSVSIKIFEFNYE